MSRRLKLSGNRRDTRREILSAGRRVVREGGPAALTFDAVAKRLGISKQAVIYWFPTKDALLAEIILPALRGEAEAAIAAVREAEGPADAIARFARAIAHYHFSDLDRFRLIYVVPQRPRRKAETRLSEGVLGQVHPVTSAMYDALEAAIGPHGSSSRAERRRRAVAIYMATLGVVLMAALTDATDDPLVHTPESLIESLVALLTSDARPTA
jgi:AcrR family transcriptional regulator